MALGDRAPEPGEKGVEKLDELSGAPGAAPTTRDVGPYVPLWGCSLPSLQREILVPCEGTQKPLRSPMAARFAPQLLRERAGQGSGRGTALPCIR